MKRPQTQFFAILLVFFFSGTNLIAQMSKELDTIIKVEGKVMPVEVEKVTTKYVRFRVPGNDELFTMPRKNIHKVIYKNGRIEEYNALVAISIDENSWKAVWLTENEEDVLSLYKRGVASVTVPPSPRSSLKASKKNAIMRLQKKAAAMQGSVVLVTKQQTTGGYGEPQGYDMEGIIYGEEPLEEEETDNP
jgi:hypothetical protein